MAAKTLKGIDLKALQQGFATIETARKAGFFGTNSYREPRTETTKTAIQNSQPDKNASQEKKDGSRADLLMLFLLYNYQRTYNAMKVFISEKIVETKDGLLNFKCKVGCVGYFFGETGCTEYTYITPNILINGNPPSITSLQNYTSNAAPKEWEALRQKIKIYVNEYEK